MKNKKACFLALLILTSCTSQYGAVRGERARIDATLDEIRMKIADLEHTQHKYHAEQAIAEEKIRNQEVSINALKKQTVSAGKISPKWEDHLRFLEKEIYELKISQEKTLADLKRLSEHANQTTSSLVNYKERIQECADKLNHLSNLKGTLDSISHAMKQSSNTAKNYKVQPGDSLEKIAKLHQISVASLKSSNHLQSDTIFVGQELKISYDAH